jgi:hypothetical protein
MTNETKPALLSKLRAPVADELPGDTRWPVLRAMARNYTAGKHTWDALDAEACEQAAEEIRHLRAALASAPVAGEARMPPGYRVKVVEGHGYRITSPSGSAWVAHSDTPAGDLIAALLAAPQASEAVRDAALEEAAQTAYKALFPTNDRSDWTEFAESAAYHAEYAAQCIRALKPQSAALSAQPGAQRTGGSDAE